MLRSKNVIVLALVIVMAVAAWAMAAGSLVDQKGVLSGRVLAQGLSAPGQAVREGDVLVVVDSIAGPAPAVRANVDGTVREVLVKPGDMIRSGDVAVRIEASRK
ncbi:MAG TPA: hypothetical protein PKA10_09165 [Selenomonadales bacterium]|nr:hypothetical protein [Selenomonadales bacterium]